MSHLQFYRATKTEGVELHTAVLGRLHIAQLISTATYKITGFPALLLADVACDFPVSVMSSLTKYNIMHTFQPNAC